MAFPLILLTGNAGSGKDSVAASLVKNHKAVAISLADPMKRFAAAVFGFTEEQLWGPSQSRNGLDTRFASQDYADKVMAEVVKASGKWIEHWLPELDWMRQAEATKALRSWASGLLSDAVREGGLSPRKMLQTLGTEWGRNVDRSLWIDYGKRTAMKLLRGNHTYNKTYGLVEEAGASGGPSIVVITDGRFRNEVIAIRALGGEAWRVHAPGNNAKAIEEHGVKNHASEAEQKTLPTHFFNAHIINNKSKGLKKLDLLVDHVYNDRIEHGTSFNVTYFHGEQWPDALATDRYLAKHGLL